MSVKRLIRTFSVPDSSIQQSKINNSKSIDENFDGFGGSPTEASQSPERTFRRRSLFSIPLFSQFRRKSLVSSKNSYSCGNSPQSRPSVNKPNTVENYEQLKMQTGGTDDHGCDSSHNTPYHDKAHKKDDIAMTTCDAEPMVSANELIAHLKVSSGCKNNKNTLSHEMLMECVSNDQLELLDKCSIKKFHKSDTCLNISDSECVDDNSLATGKTSEISCKHSPNSIRHCASEGNTPQKFFQRSYSESSKRAPKKYRLASQRTTCPTLSSESYVQTLLYGDETTEYDDESADQNNNNHNERPNNLPVISTDNLIPSTDSTPQHSPAHSPGASVRRKLFGFSSPKHRKSSLTSPKKSPLKVTSPGKAKINYDTDKESLTGYLYVNLHSGKGFSRNSDTYVVLEMDSYGHFFRKAKTKALRGSDPQWEESFEFEIEACNTLRLSCFNKLRLMGDDISGKCSINLTKENLTDNRNHTLVVSLDRGQTTLKISLSFSTSIDGIKKSPSFSDHGVFGVPIMVVCKRENFHIPVIVISCIKEIEKRGMDELGIYRLSGIASEIQNLKKFFNEQTQNALLALADTDIHAVAGLLKLYFRELPQSLFTSKLYRKFVAGLSITDSEEKEMYMLDILHQLPKCNKITALYLFEHLRRVVLLESQNKMGVNNLATVFGPTVLRPPSSNNDKDDERSSCNVGTFDIGALDVMSQVGIFRYFLGMKNNERVKLPEDDLELWQRLDPEKASALQLKMMREATEEHLI